MAAAAAASVVVSSCALHIATAPAYVTSAAVSAAAPSVPTAAAAAKVFAGCNLLQLLQAPGEQLPMGWGHSKECMGVGEGNGALLLHSLPVYALAEGL
jgi:hypothetical protein